MLITRGNYKNNPIHKVLEGIKWEETKKCNKNLKRQQTGTGSRKEQCMMNNAQDGEHWQWRKHSYSAPFFFKFCSSFLLGSDLQR